MKVWFSFLVFLCCAGICKAQFLNIYSHGQSLGSFEIADVDSITVDKRENLWRQAETELGFYYAPGWTQIANPAYTYEDGVYKVTWSKATSTQWMAQMYLKTNLTASAYKRYDFRITLKSNKTLKAATIKLYEDGNDNLYFFEEKVNLTANVPLTFEKKDMNGLDMKRVCLIMDFGGNSINTVTEVSNIVLQESDYDSSTDINSCPLEGYSLVWNDEFKNAIINTTKWTFQNAEAGWVNHELQTYVSGRSPSGKKVAECSNGTLKINCFRDGNKIYSARMYGRRSVGFKYCYVEARIKLPKGKGTWPAFWMMPVSGSNWPADGEIDIMEEVGVDANQVSSSIHCTAYHHPAGTQKTHAMNCVGAEDGFHIYAMEWTEDYIRTYVDGQEQLYFENDKQGNKDTWPFNTAFYPILNLAWGGDWGGYAGVDESALPVTMEVDYIRVWQKK